MNFDIEPSVSQVFSDIHWRILFLWMFIVLFLGFLVINLFDLQIVNGEENLIRARNISQSEDIIRAPRGVIYDRNGVILAKNVPGYSIYINSGELEKEREDLVFERLSRMIHVDKKELLKTYQSKAYTKKQEKLPQTKVTLSNDITYDQYIKILTSGNELEGVHTIETPRRSYPYGSSISHVVGYVSDINEDEVEKTGLDANSTVGKEGIEKTYDEELRGQDGRSIQTQDIFRDRTQEFISQSPVSGENIFLTIDIKWQLKLEELLKTRVRDAEAFGAVVIVMETDTGKVRGMVNYPSYDNNLFAKGISANDFDKLNTDTSTPLINRAIALQLPTGSIFKPMVASAALESGAISRYTSFESGCVDLPLYRLCEADNQYLGTMTVVEGIGKSSNVFFCKTGLAMVENADGINTLKKYTDQFGIGKKTGIQLPGEQRGTMASPAFKLERQGEPWYLADICNTVIGQGLVTATPMQMVSVASTIGTEGKVLQPLLVESSERQDGTIEYKAKPKVKRKVSVSEANFSIVREGMNYAVNGDGGSAWLLRDVPGNPYAKTGSSDAVEYRNGVKVDGAHSWAMGGFEYEGKAYSFVVHMQEGGRGYQSVPVMADFIRWLYQ